MSDAGIILVVDQINKTVKHKEITAFLLAAGYQQEVVFHISSTAFFSCQNKATDSKSLN